MEILKYILVAIYMIVCIAIVIVVLLQPKADAGLSGAIAGNSGANNFYEQNKGRTREGKLKRSTIVLGIVFVVIAIALGIVYMV